MNAISPNLRPLSIVRVLTLVGIISAPATGQRQKQRASEANQTKIETGKNQPQISSADRFTPADGARTVHDKLLKVTWLLDANVGKSECKTIANADSGGMDWSTAWACIQQLNSGKGLLGHTNWQMPATAMVDSTCPAVGQQGNSFGENCTGSAYGSLYYGAWRRHFGETVAWQSGPTKGGLNCSTPVQFWPRLV